MSNLRKKININSEGQEIFTSINRANVDTVIGDSSNLDAFSRLRVSEVSTLFDSQLQYGLMSLFWNQSITGNATITHLPNESSARLRCTTTSGDKAIRQTKRYIRYQPGKSQLIAITTVMGSKKTNVRQRIGLFDNLNGLFFEQDENNLKVVRRSNTSGSPVDVSIDQSNWNIDKLDGTGRSGFTLDMSKSQILIIDYQWLGVGRVRYGFDINGVIYYCHEMVHANNLSTVYMSTPNLPVRYEIENIGISQSNTDMIQICSSVVSEGGFADERGITHSFSNGINTIGVTTRRPILSVRPKITFNSTINRSEILPINFDIFASGNSAFYEIIINGDISTASWIDGGVNSVCEYDVSSTTITGGEVIESGFIPASASIREAFNSSLISKLALTNNLTGNSTDTISIVITSFAGTTTVSGELTLKELY